MEDGLINYQYNQTEISNEILILNGINFTQNLPVDVFSYTLTNQNKSNNFNLAITGDLYKYNYTYKNDQKITIKVSNCIALNNHGTDYQSFFNILTLISDDLFCIPATPNFEPTKSFSEDIEANNVINNSSFKTILIIAIVIGSVLIIGVIVLLLLIKFCNRRKREETTLTIPLDL